jgi:hypothetical protein
MRYLLAAGMMPYGISKLANLQFQVGASDYIRPPGEINGKVLTWAFLGYQPWFQFLLGVLEILPALLLCFRRTWRLGALLLFPVLANVTLMNFAMDLWHNTKIISASLLALNLTLLAWSFPTYRPMLAALLTRPKPIAKHSWRTAGHLAEIAIPVAGIVLFGIYFFRLASSTQQFDFTGDHQINRAGSWSIEQMTFGGRETAAVSDRHIYFDFGRGCIYVLGTQSTKGRYQANRGRHTFEISGVPLADDGATLTGTYRVEGRQLILSGEHHNQPFRIVLARFNWWQTSPFEPALAIPNGPAQRCCSQ